jgi:hypothetical protein
MMPEGAANRMPPKPPRPSPAPVSQSRRIQQLRDELAQLDGDHPPITGSNLAQPDANPTRPGIADRQPPVAGAKQ